MFIPQVKRQLPGHCGPCALANCLAVFGIKTTQRKVAWSAGNPVRVYWNGLDEEELCVAAGRYGVKAREVMICTKRKGRDFSNKLKRHLREGPAILLIEDCGHWVSVLEYKKGSKKFKYLVYDSYEAKAYRWSEKRLMKEAWNEPEEGPAQYCAILLRKERR